MIDLGKDPQYESRLESREDRTWAMCCHLAGLLGTMVMGIGNILIPLLIWLLRREGSALVDDQGKEVINFQITLFVVYMTLLILGALTLIFMGLGFLVWMLMIPVGIFEIIFSIIGMIKANDGEYFRYPFCIRFLR